MNRIKVELPEKFSFQTTMRIRITDINYGGHVGNDAFLSLIHEARQRFLLHYNYEELKLGSFAVIMADAAIEFKRELNYGEEVIISVAAANFDKYSFDIFYKMEVNTSDGFVLAGKAKTGMICFDYAVKKKVSLEEEVIRTLSGKEG
ncbi:MAG: acyl-CoA thioesterase [Ilyomonas sp.]